MTMAKKQRRRGPYYSPASDTYHLSLAAAVRAARKALAGSGEACSITFEAGGVQRIVAAVSDPASDGPEGGRE